MTDIITKIGNSKIQHGKFNNRIYLMSLDKKDLPQIITEMDKLAINNNYSKIFAKIPVSAEDLFLNNGYTKEAVIPGFYNNTEDGLFLSKYFNAARSKLSKEEKEEVESIIRISLDKKNKKTILTTENGYQLMPLAKNRVDQAAKIYKSVFNNYPFPIDDPQYIKKTMRENIKYFACLYKNQIIGLSSAEIYKEHGNAEMTDFATINEFRGKGIAGALLELMETEIKNMGIYTVYTIARSIIPGINIMFAKADYNFSGSLIKNTRMDKGFETMNIWYKSLSSSN
jgi:putative beta-lysine N-acetyltransferase